MSILFSSLLKRLLIIALPTASLIGCEHTEVQNDNHRASSEVVANYDRSDWKHTQALCSQSQLDQPRASSFGCYRGYSEAQYDQFIRESVYVPVRDGVRLAVDIYRPVKDGKAVTRPMPVIFTFSRYWRATEHPDGMVSTYVGRMPIGQSTIAIKAALDNGSQGDVQGVGLLLAHGYTFVRAEARGTGASYGLRNGDLSGVEALDGKNIVEWIVQQPWSNGRVGMIGQSYEGMSQYLVASANPEGLKAILPGVATFDEYRASWSGAGVLRKYGLAWLAREAKRDGVQKGVESSSINPVDRSGKAVARVDADIDGSQRAAARQERLSDPEATNPMLYFIRQSPEAGELVAAISRAMGTDSPAQIMETLYSVERLSALIEANPELQQTLSRLSFYRDQSEMLKSAQDVGPNNLATLVERINNTDIAVYNWGGWTDFASIDTLLWYVNLDTGNKLTKLAMGPWTHGPNERDDRKEDASYVLRRIEQLRWADFHLRGIGNGMDLEPRATFATLRSSQEFDWQHRAGWPVADTSYRSWYLAPEGGLSAVRGSAGSSGFEVDFTSTLGEQTRYHDAIGLGPNVLPDLTAHGRNGALSFTTAPLEKAVTVTGSAVVSLFLSANVPVVDVNGYLEVVERDGTVRMLADGVMKTSHRRLGQPTYDNLGLPWSDSRKDVVMETPAIEPGRPVRVEFDLQPTSVVFNKGERIRLVVTGAEAHTNLTIPRPTPVRIELAHGGSRASELRLPVQVVE
jgi:predicted acyl esterase